MVSNHLQALRAHQPSVGLNLKGRVNLRSSWGRAMWELREEGCRRKANRPCAPELLPGEAQVLRISGETGSWRRPRFYQAPLDHEGGVSRNPELAHPVETCGPR